MSAYRRCVRTAAVVCVCECSCTVRSRRRWQLFLCVRSRLPRHEQRLERVHVHSCPRIASLLSRLTTAAFRALRWPLHVSRAYRLFHVCQSPAKRVVRYAGRRRRALFCHCGSHGRVVVSVTTAATTTSSPARVAVSASSRSLKAPMLRYWLVMVSS